MTPEREPRGVYVMGASGENPRRASNLGLHPSRSPDGRHLYFVSDRGGNMGTWRAA